MKRHVSKVARKPVSILVLCLLLALMGAIAILIATLILALVGVVQAAPADSAPDVEAVLTPGLELSNPGYAAGSPISQLYADNADGVHAYGQGVVIRGSDGYSWTLSIDADQVFLTPLSDIFTVTNGVITETWAFSVDMTGTASFTGIRRNDAWFEAALTAVPNPAVIAEPITYTLIVTNTGSMTGTTAYCDNENICSWLDLGAGEVYTEVYAVRNYTATGTYPDSVTIQWDNGYSRTIETVVVVTATPPQCIPITDISINGPTTGTINVEYTFTTSVSPLTATKPITLNWNPLGFEEGVYGWTNPGVKTIMVTATNACSTVTTNHIISISAEPPVTPTLTISGPITGVTNTMYTFIGTSDFTATEWIWKTGWRTRINYHPGLYDTASFSWSQPGIYTLTLQTQNEMGGPIVATATHTITIVTTPPVTKTYYVFMPATFRNYTPPTIVDRGTVNLKAGEGWTNPEGPWFGGKEFLSGLYAPNREFLSITIADSAAVVTCNNIQLNPTDDDNNGYYDAGCTSPAPWLVDIRLGNIIERWHIVLN